MLNSVGNVGRIGSFLYKSKLLSFIGALDNISPSAAAFSTRRLRTAYTGPLMRVRRSSDNVELDIGFDSNGWLDEAALLSHVGAGNSGFVTTWYDQSGNARNATQTTAASQPRIVDAGVVEVLGGKPALYLNGAKPLVASLASTVATGLHYNLVYRLFGFQDSFMFTLNGPVAFFNDANRAGARLSIRNDAAAGFTDTTGARDANPHVGGWGWNGATAQRYFDGVATGGSGSLGGTLTLNTLTIGINGPTLNAWQSEAILFVADLSTADRQTLERNQGAAFGITVA